MRPAYLRMYTAVAGVLLALAGSPSAARAAEGNSEPPVTAVLKTDTGHSDDEGLAGAVERVTRAKLDALDVVELAGTPALGLDDLQLAVGCAGDTTPCLDAVASQLEVEALLLSRIDRAGETRVLTITYFDARSDERESVVRRVEGPRTANQMLDGVEGQLRELFGLPAPRTPAEPDPSAAEVDRPGVPAMPLVVAGAGLAILAAGGALGVKAQDNEDAYAAVGEPSRPLTAAEAERANDLYEKADRQAKIAYALFGVGGALVAGGTVLLFLMRDGQADDDEEGRSMVVAPAVGAGTLGLTLAGRYGGAR